MKAFFTFLLITLITTSNSSVLASNTNEPIDVSLINLIATPEKYDGKLIRVVGYLNLEFEGNALYFHKEDYEKSLFRNAIWVNFTRKEAIEKTKTFSKQYVVIEGTFVMNDTGHMGLFSGGVTQISRLDLWKLK